jgi:SARP family transcriptional regulator, regulator of embCAB operon
MPTEDAKLLPSSLQFQVLGPLRVFRSSEPCTPSALKQRALLALLLLKANELLPTNRLIDELWDSHPPVCAVAALQMYVSGVRRAITPQGGGSRRESRCHPVLQTQPSGYLIKAGPGQLDLVQFRSLGLQGRMRLAEGRCQESGELFRQALSLWRGDALADLSGVTALRHQATHLEEERLALLQARIGVDLCQGQSLETVGELGEICFRHPLREDFQEQLMLALYLSGRRADALAAYRRLYQIMTDELGIEPGPGMRRMQQAVIRGSEPGMGIHDGHLRPGQRWRDPA